MVRALGRASALPRPLPSLTLLSCTSLSPRNAEARECYDLEKFYEDMRVDVDPWEGMTYDEWLERHPIPEKWLRRLERDEMED